MDSKVSEALAWLRENYDSYFAKYRMITLRDLLMHPFTTFKQLFLLTKGVVVAVEAKSKEMSFTGAQKRELAVAYLNEKLDIKFVFFDEAREAVVFGQLVDLAVWVVNWVNQNHSWPSSLLEKAKEMFDEIEKLLNAAD